ncbi:ATP-binding cassette domain-containing protein, partial [Clostridium perfringens]
FFFTPIWAPGIAEGLVGAESGIRASAFITRLAVGNDKVLGIGGEGISQGQKQLLAIARALLADPSILVLDEATSSIDTVTEIKIQEGLQRLMRGRTSFVIAHRLNTIRQADKILVLQGGRLIEQGDRETLMAEGGFYSRLVQAYLEDRTRDTEEPTGGKPSGHF